LLASVVELFAFGLDPRDRRVSTTGDGGGGGWCEEESDLSLSASMGSRPPSGNSAAPVSPPTVSATVAAEDSVESAALGAAAAAAALRSRLALETAARSTTGAGDAGGECSCCCSPPSLMDPPPSLSLVLTAKAADMRGEMTRAWLAACGDGSRLACFGLVQVSSFLRHAVVVSGNGDFRGETARLCLGVSLVATVCSSLSPVPAFKP
jgi:hypothetical protein